MYFDFTVFHWLNHFAGHIPPLDALMAFFARYALELYAVLFIAAWFTLPKNNLKHRHALVVAGFAGILALAINYLIAHVWYRPRPFVVLPAGTYTKLIPHVADASFPSDHTAGGFGFAAASWGKGAKWISYAFTILGVIVAIARVYVGVHWPTDVLAGVLVGTLAGKVMWKLSPLLYPLTSLGVRLCRFNAGKRA